MMIPTNDVVAQQTLHWIKSFVIEYNICPFAKGAVNKEALRIKVSETRQETQALEDLMAEIFLLDDNVAIETTLLVFPNVLHDFFTYLDFIDLAEQLISDQGYEGIYQLASFHPDYCFSDTDPQDVTNYTNRSPYPMLHLLREDQLEKAIAAYGDTNKIFQRNCLKMRELGIKKLKNNIDLLGSVNQF